MRTPFISAFLVVLSGATLAGAQQPPAALPTPTPAPSTAQAVEVAPPPIEDENGWSFDLGKQLLATRIWVSGAYLHWWMNAPALPPLITRGSPNDPIPDYGTHIPVTGPLTEYHKSVASRYNYAFGKNYPFLPSNATSSNGQFLSPRSFYTAKYCGHCHQQALMGMESDEKILSSLGLDFRILDSGCCGMAGNFGFQPPHYDVSVQIGARGLLPAVRKADPDTLIIADGFSCREQISQATGRRALHLAQVIQQALHAEKSHRSA